MANNFPKLKVMQYYRLKAIREFNAEQIFKCLDIYF